MLLYRWLRESADERGSAKALVYRDTYLSWRGLLHRVDRRAQEFAAMGIGPGMWVGLMLGNVPDFVTLALSLSKLGAVIVPLDPTTSSRELELVLEAAPLRALVTRPRGGEPTAATTPPGAPAPPPARPSANARKPIVPESRRRLQGTLLTCSLYKRAPAEAPAKTTAVLFTSDSTGDPKGVIRTEAQLEAAASLIARTLDVKADEKVLTTVPLFAAYGFDFGLLLALRYGVTLFLEDEVAPKRIAKVLREQAIEIVPATPVVFSALAKIPTAKALKTKNPRFLATGAALSEAVAESFRARYGVRLMSCYHTTETGPVSIDRRAQTPTSVGKPFEGVEVRVADGDGAPVAADRQGILWIKSAACSAAAIRPYATPRRPAGRVLVGACDAAGWLRTGDLGRVDRSGRIFLEGREDDLVKIDGKRVALGEVEGCLESFPKVKAAQAMVITDPLAGPMVVARVVALGRCGAEEIIDHCAKNLAPYKVPRRIEFCETLPS